MTAYPKSEQGTESASRPLTTGAAPPQNHEGRSSDRPRDFLRAPLAGVAAVLIAFAFLMCSGCQATSTLGGPEGWIPQAPVTLAPGDVVKLTFPGAPELSQSQKIRADGRITLPLIGEIGAAGKRLSAFQVELAERYRSQIRNQEIIVTLEASAIPVYVSGAVNRPGKIVIERPMTVLEGIMEAGGFSQRANPRKVVLVRVAQGQHTTRVFDLNPVLRGNTTGVFYLKPYDVIYVQESIF